MENTEREFKDRNSEKNVIKNLSNYINFIKHLPSHKHEKLIDELSRLDINNLTNL